MTQTAQQENHAEEQAKTQMDSIREMVLTLRAAKTDEEREEAEDAIHEDPLSVEVRGDWHTPGEKGSAGVSEYKILLCTGGPAVQIVGELNQCGEPETAEIQHQDWFLPWTTYRVDEEDTEILLEYARQFYFAE